MCYLSSPVAMGALGSATFSSVSENSNLQVSGSVNLNINRLSSSHKTVAISCGVQQNVLYIDNSVVIFHIGAINSLPHHPVQPCGR